MKNKSLRPGWRLVRLGDVADVRTEVESNPLSSPHSRFVGSNHIGRFDLKVRAWGASTAVTSSMRVFHPGDYLFVRRSLYASDFRERAARADFAGLCSGDILPIRENPQFIASGFLGVVLNHPTIWQFVVSNATGSITRRIKWKQLREYTFALPPLEEQRRITNLVLVSYNAYRSVAKVAEQAVVVEQAFLESHMTEAWSSFPRTPLPELCERLTVGIVVTPAKYYVPSGGVPVLRSLNVFKNRYVLDELQRISIEGHRLHQKSALRAGDVIIVRTGDPGRPGNAAVVPEEMDGWNCVDLIVSTPKNVVQPRYLMSFINWSRSARLMQALAPGTKQKHLSIKKLDQFHVPVPPLKWQQAVADDQRTLVAAVREANQRRDAMHRIHSTLMQRVLQE